MAILCGLLLLEAGLIWYDLGSREVLGRDENVTIVHVDQPSLKAVLDTIDVRFTGQSGNMQPLYFLLQRMYWPLVGHSAFVLRFLPSAFGILAIVLTYKLGAVLLGREAGIMGAMLTALLPLHIRYAQIVRPYPLLVALSLASAYLLVRALKRGRPLDWAAFVVVSVINFYTHYNSVFVLAAEGLVAGLLWVTRLAAAANKRGGARQLVAPAASFALVGLACLPSVSRVFGMTGGAEGETVGRIAVELSRPFFRGVMFRSGLMSGSLQALVVGLAVMGLMAAVYRRRWWAALLAALWISLPFIVLSIVESPRPFEERYIIFVPPMLFLMVGEGAVAVAELISRATKGSARNAVRRGILAATCAGLALLLIKPLQVSYAYGRSGERLDEFLALVEKHAGQGETVVVSPRFPVRPLETAGAEVLYLGRHPTPAEIAMLAQKSERLWILYTSYIPPAELQEPLDVWVQAHEDAFWRVPIKTVNALAFGRLGTADVEASLQADIAVLEELAGQSVSKYEAWQRHEVLAVAYEALGKLYGDQGRLEMAEEYRTRAEAARAAAPPP